MNDPCLECPRVKRCRSEAAFARCEAYKLYKKSQNGERLEIDLKQSPCERCVTLCSGTKFARCREYLAWLKARMERLRTRPPEDKQAEPAERERAYAAHLRWMEEHARWKG